MRCFWFYQGMVVSDNNAMLEICGSLLTEVTKESLL